MRRVRRGMTAGVVATAVIGGLIVGTASGAGAEPGRLGADAVAPGPSGRPDSGAAVAGGGVVARAFAGAAAEFGVPLPVLTAVGYESSWWESHAGQPSASSSYGIMGLTDVPAAGGMDGRPAEDLAAGAGGPSAHTLADAAHLIGESADKVRDDDTLNIRAGAALLASYQQQLTNDRPVDPGKWYGSVARYSQSSQESGARLFADAVFHVVRDGAKRTLPDGQTVQVGATSGVVADAAQAGRLGLASGTGGRAAECPAGLDCRFLPAVAGNFQEADRPDNGIKIDRIIVHDTELSYDKTIAEFQNPASHVSAHYVVRSSDGAVTQMVPTKDIAFQAGNYWFNMHTIGVEHEGVAAEGAKWYTPAQYQASATLVRYLAERFGVPLDREHIIGHDNVPGSSASTISGMHWDPGPYWDWTRYMTLLRGGNTDAPAPQSPPAVGSAVTIAPDFARNMQTVKVCGDTPPCACREQTAPSNFLYVRTGPDETAPLFPDPALHPGERSGSDRIEDWGSKVTAGQQFVVADQHGDWTAIWYSGSKVWFLNPGGRNTTPGSPGATIVRPQAGPTQIPVYGGAYPQPDEYPPGFKPEVHPPNFKPDAQVPLGVYTVPQGQAYVATAPPNQADDYFTEPHHQAVFGHKHYLTIQLDHRTALLDTEDVTTQTAGPGTER